MATGPFMPAVPFLGKNDIRSAAARFPGQYHPSGDIPVPIEETAEFRLCLDIVPIPGVQRILGVDGCLARNLHEILVDDFVFNNRPNRYRFTLAHEIGHIVLHEAVYHSLPRFTTTHEWKAIVNSIPPGDNDRLEWQANEFAGLVLVPPGPLEVEGKKALNRILLRMKSEGVTCVDEDFAWDCAVQDLARRFEVSSKPIDMRLRRDKLR